MCARSNVSEEGCLCTNETKQLVLDFERAPQQQDECMLRRIDRPRKKRGREAYVGTATKITIVDRN